MEAQANTTREQSKKKSIEIGDPRMVEMEEKEKKYIAKPLLCHSSQCYDCLFEIYVPQIMKQVVNLSFSC